VGSEESLHTMREYLLDRRGTCSLFFHVSGTNGTPEVVVQASLQIQVADSPDVLDRIREFPQVADVWKE
jgi:hypothetical protein